MSEDKNDTVAIAFIFVVVAIISFLVGRFC